MITLKQLETFVQIVELGTYERAARRLNATQSTISKRISELEASCGLQVFDRSKRHNSLTVEGEKLLDIAISTLENVNKISSLSQQCELQLRHVKAGFTDLIAQTWLPKFISTFTEDVAGIHMEIAIGMGRSLYHQLIDGELDLIVTPEFTDTVIQDGIKAQQLGAVEMAFMAHPKYVNSSSPMEVAEMARFPILTQGNQAGLSHLFGRWMREHGGKLQPFMNVSNLLAQVALTAAGHGVSILPKNFVKALNHTPRMQEIQTSPKIPDANYIILYRGGPREHLLREISQSIANVADFDKPFFI
ncbi:MAG: LysR family transcriptional regulator [Porticoccaceae bacterium]|nr:LysR family transcriptional regulator [Porticoccaceae bacterium]